MDENTNTEHDKYEIAVQISVLSYDLNVENPKVATMMRMHSLDGLVAKRDELLAKIDEQVALDGFYAVPSHMDAKWLATLMQTELGSYVDAGEYSKAGAKAIVPVEPGSV